MAGAGAGAEPIELIRLEGEGNSVVLRVAGVALGGPSGAGPVLEGEISVDTPFVAGATPVFVYPDDLDAWQDALDVLDAGGDIAWREGGPGPELHIELDPGPGLLDGKAEAEPDSGSATGLERAHVSVSDIAGALTTVTVTVTVDDTWFDEAYERLERVRQAWPTVEESAAEKAEAKSAEKAEAAEAAAEE